MRRIFNDVKIDLFVYSILTLLLSIAMVSEAYLMQVILDSIKSNESQYLVVSFVIVLFFILQSLLYFMQQYLTSMLSKKSAYFCRKSLFMLIQNMPLNLIMGEKYDKILPTMTVLIDQIDHNYFYSIYWGGYLICQLVIAIVISIFINPLMSLFTIVLSLPNLLVTVLSKKNLEFRQENLVKTTNETTFIIQDMIEGLRDWKITGDHEGISDLFDKTTFKLLQDQIKVEKSQYIIASLNQLFSNLLYFGSWLVGGFLILKGYLSLGLMVSFSQLLLRISYPVYASSDLLAKYISGRKVIESLYREFELINDSEVAIDKISTIELRNVVMDQESQKTPINLKFNREQKYLMIGKSGSGKTRLIKTIIKEFNTFEGSIFLDDMNIDIISENALFEHVGYVPQKPHLFRATLRENLTLLSDNFSDERLFKVLKFVELPEWANEESLDITLSDEERSISGGEVKRISLARALLREPDILLIDEFSSGLDSITLKKIEKKLFEMDKMIVYITHVDVEELKNIIPNVINLDDYF